MERGEVGKEPIMCKMKWKNVNSCPVNQVSPERDLFSPEKNTFTTKGRGLVTLKLL